ncbi:MAG: Sterol carrier family protein, partial [uncultured Rubellimicrobium sp.]
ERDSGPSGHTTEPTYGGAELRGHRHVRPDGRRQHLCRSGRGAERRRPCRRDPDRDARHIPGHPDGDAEPDLGLHERQARRGWGHGGGHAPGLGPWL